ncbi:replication protein RepA (plasmid) [Pseudomonas corrugata]|uniref:replication protein RepA n=1 Tax=Pseudomonas corrugata TaxID=47879 RepID=UPI003D8141C5
MTNLSKNGGRQTASNGDDGPFDEAAYRADLIAAGFSAEDAAAVASNTARHRADAGRKGGPKRAEFQTVGGIVDRSVMPAAKRAAARKPAEPAPVAKFPTVEEKERLLRKPWSTEMLPRHRQLIEDALEIEQEEARAAGALGYMARTLAQATLPHTDPKLPAGTLYSRDTGRLTLSVAPTSRRHGIPYGSIPRVILAWICSEAVKTKERTLSLGHSQSDFLESLKLHNNGRDIARFREQALRLFKSVISVEYTDERDGDLSARLLISESSHVFWHPKASEQRGLWESSLELSEGFFREIMAAPVPIDMRVFHALSKSPLAMDVYTWLTYRMFVLRRSGRSSAFVPWAGLKSQFGAGYPDTDQGFRDFKKRFRLRLKEVLLFYPAAQGHIQETPVGLALTPCELHIAHTNGAKLSSLPKPKPKA